MRPARGDPRPCVQKWCTGVMQYSRRPLEARSLRRNDALRWVCSVDRSHTSYATDEAQMAGPVPR
jgi:hypothetical protein